MSASAWSPAVRRRARRVSIERAPATETTSAVSTSGRSSRYPSATPRKATCPIPSPIRLSRRCTRKKPTAGARSPTTMPAPNASRMNSRSSMGVRGVVPDTRQGRRGPVEHDPLPNQDDPLDEVLDRAELVRYVEDRHPELVAQPHEQRRDRLLSLDVDARGRLVDREQLRLSGQRLRDERALLLTAGKRGEPAVC